MSAGLRFGREACGSRQANWQGGLALGISEQISTARHWEYVHPVVMDAATTAYRYISDIVAAMEVVCEGGKGGRQTITNWRWTWPAQTIPTVITKPDQTPVPSDLDPGLIPMLILVICACLAFPGPTSCLVASYVPSGGAQGVQPARP